MLPDLVIIKVTPTHIGAVVIKTQTKRLELASHFRAKRTDKSNQLLETLTYLLQDRVLMGFADESLPATIRGLFFPHKDPAPLGYLDLWSLAIVKGMPIEYKELSDLAKFVDRKVNDRLYGDAYYDAFELAMCARKLLHVK